MKSAASISKAFLSDGNRVRTAGIGCASLYRLLKRSDKHKAAAAKGAA